MGDLGVIDARAWRRASPSRVRLGAAMTSDDRDPDRTAHPLKAPASASVGHARAWARQRRALRLREVDAYLTELWRLASRLGYDPVLLAAQSSFLTDGWTSPGWETRLDPASLIDATPHLGGAGFDRGMDAARAHVVHVTAHARGYDPRVRSLLSLDPGWQRVFEQGLAGRSRHFDQLAVDWSPNRVDLASMERHRRGIVQAIRTADVTLLRADLTSGGESFVQSHATGNWSPRPAGQAPVAIVVHRSERPDTASAIAWYTNPASRSSRHALIDAEGVIQAFVGPLDAAWANDDPKNLRAEPPWLAAALERRREIGASIDLVTLALEYLGPTGAPPTARQHESMVAVAASWATRFAIPIDAAHMIGHSEINSVDRGDCPGPGFDRAAFIAAVLDAGGASSGKQSRGNTR